MEGRREQTESAFPWGSFIPSVFSIALPVALQNLLTTTGTMVDTMMIGSLGEEYLAATGLCSQFSSLMFSCYWGFAGGAILFYSQYWGNGDMKGLKKAYGITTMLMMSVSAIFALLALFFPRSVMSLYTDKAPIIDAGSRYLRTVGWAYPLQVYAVGLSTLHRSTGKVRIPLLASILSVITNIFLNWVLIYGNLGAPAMGIEGAATATIAAATVNVAAIVVSAFISRFSIVYDLRGQMDQTKAFAVLYLRKCFPVLLSEVLVGTGYSLISMVMGRQNESAIAAVAAFKTIEGLVIGFFAGFSSAVSVLVGSAVGAGKLDDAYRRAWRIVYLCQSVILIVSISSVMLSERILTLMSLSGESLGYGRGAIAIYAAASVIRMGNWTMNDTFRSSGDAVIGSVLEISFMYILVLPLVALSGLVWHLPFFAVFAFCYCDEPLRYILMQRHLWAGLWVKPVTEEGKGALLAFRERHGIRR